MSPKCIQNSSVCFYIHESSLVFTAGLLRNSQLHDSFVTQGCHLQLNPVHSTSHPVVIAQVLEKINNHNVSFTPVPFKLKLSHFKVLKSTEMWCAMNLECHETITVELWNSTVFWSQKSMSWFLQTTYAAVKRDILEVSPESHDGVLTTLARHIQNSWWTGRFLAVAQRRSKCAPVF